MDTDHSSCVGIMPHRQIVVQGDVNVKIHIGGGVFLAVIIVLAVVAVVFVALLR